MKFTLIKSYARWLNEEADYLASTAKPEQPSQNTAADGVAFIEASTSSTNITDDLAQRLGLKTGTLYTLNLKSLSQLKYLADDGKYGGPAISQGLAQPFDATGTLTKPGDNIITVNGKTINGSGSFIILKSEIPQGTPVQIQFAGNGMLLLMRLAGALKDMAEKDKFQLGYAKAYAIKFTLGGSVDQKDSRGFSYQLATPGGQLNSQSDALIGMLSINLLNAAGHTDQIAVNDKVFGPLFNNYIKGNDGQTATRKIAEFVANNLTKLKMLATVPPADTSAAWTQLGDINKLMVSDNSKKKWVLTNDGVAKFKFLMTEVSKAILPTTSSAGFGNEASSVMSEYSKTINAGLLGGVDKIQFIFEVVQSSQNWGSPVNVPKGVTAKGTEQHGEGQF
jgi:hypothetical protein